MRWLSALSQAGTLEECVAECAARLGDQSRPDLLVVFISGHFSEDYEALPGLLQARLAPRQLVGCSGGGVIGDARECEFSPAVSVTAGWLPGVELTGYRLEGGDLPDLDAPPDRWCEIIGAPARCEPGFILLCDPFSFNTGDMLRGLDYAYPGQTTVGGLASGSRRPGGNGLFLNAECRRSGAVGVALAGNIRLDSVVAQGCRPIGESMVITRCRGNMIEELDHRSPLICLQEVLQGATQADRLLARTSLFLGIGMGGFRLEFSAGDFLIRNILGLVPETGGLVVGARPRVGQAVQFHLRDRKTSREALDTLLERYRREQSGAAPCGALLFSCLGRGTHLYGRENHDSEVFLDRVGSIPLGGFFCNGEIGPVGDTTYLHGYTSCFGLFAPG